MGEAGTRMYLVGTDMEILAKRLKRLREAKGWSQPELARRAKISQSFVGALESGAQNNSKVLPEIAHTLGVDCFWLKTGLGSPAGPGVPNVAGVKMILDALPLLPDAILDSWRDDARRAIEAASAKSKPCRVIFLGRIASGEPTPTRPEL